MKKTFVLLISILTIVSCGDDLEFNSPAIQAKKDGVVWRAQIYTSDIDNGGLIVQGKNNGETLTLVATDDQRGTYVLGGESLNEAQFKDANGVTYSTFFSPNESLQLYPPDGELIIERFHHTADPLINLATGSFWFNAFTESGLSTVNFNQGKFYRVPIVGGILVLDLSTSCQDAGIETTEAEEAFLAANETMENYTNICNAYREALLIQIIACEDNTNPLQNIVDSLGDCIP